jgi:hypothetical protein
MRNNGKTKKLDCFLTPRRNSCHAQTTDSSIPSVRIPTAPPPIWCGCWPSLQRCHAFRGSYALCQVVCARTILLRCAVTIGALLSFGYSLELA